MALDRHNQARWRMYLERLQLDQEVAPLRDRPGTAVGDAAARPVWPSPPWAPARDTDMAVGDVLRGLMKKIDGAASSTLSAVQKEWPGLVGTAIAGHARPVRLDDRRTLTVAVDNAALLSELVRFHKTRLLAGLQQSFGRETIQALRFQAGAAASGRP